jgi:hypothetical protein
MKFLITLLLLGLSGQQFASAGAIDDVVSKFDRHGLWSNGAFIPIVEPPDIPAAVLAEKILTSYGKSSKDLEILETRDLRALKIGTSGFKGMHVRSFRTTLYPPPAAESAEEWVIVYHFQGGAMGWWSRLYPIQEEKAP